MRDEQKAKVRKQFGASAGEYVTSEVHAKGERLSLLVERVKPEKSWRALDIATGAGHTAMAIPPRRANGRHRYYAGNAAENGRACERARHKKR